MNLTGLFGIIAAAGLLVVPGAARQDADPVSGGRRVYVVRPGESLAGLGARFGIEPRVIASVNYLRPDAQLRAGQWIVIDDTHLVPPREAADEIVINLPQRMLFRFEEGALAAAYPVAVGHPDWPTFVGPFTVTAMEIDPVWDVPASIQEARRRAGLPVVTRVLPGPANPLGRHWIGLDRRGFGIHGTNAPGTIFSYRTHGCVRLHPDDMAALFRATWVGATGRVIYAPIQLAETATGRILLEVHPDPYHRQGDGLAVVQSLSRLRGLTTRIDWDAVAIAVRQREGSPVNVALDAAR
jgi:L,D-transpeptidase ErfK/SrfK